MMPGFTFQVGEGEKLNVGNVVYQALGGASMCWEHVDRAGVFLSERALEVGERLIEALGLDKDQEVPVS
jgi:hypothetical protein